MRGNGVSGDRSAIPYVVADAVALVTFVLVGIRSHHEIGLWPSSCGTPFPWR